MQAFTGLDGLARDLALGDAGRLGHHMFITSRGDARDEDLEHPAGQTAVLADRLIGGDFDLSKLSRLGIPATEPGFADAKFALSEGRSPIPRAVVDDVAVGLPALPLGPGELCGAPQQTTRP